MPQRSDAWHKETRERMWELPPRERMAALALTCVQCNSRDTRAAVLGFLALAEMMACMHGEQVRSGIACDARDFADRVEQSMTMVVN